MDYGDYPSAGTPAGLIAVYIIIILLMIISMWKIYTKAGKPGWAAIIPIYNIIVLLEIVGKPLWWIILWLLVPLANLIVYIIVNIELAKKLEKGPDLGSD